ncbi:HD domain-containing protein [Thalassotalea fusca]
MDLNKQLSFILELDKLKSVYRKALIKTDNNRFENSAEHSWQIALAAHVLVEHVEHNIDINRAVKMLLIHDIVEIDAGDTFAFAEVNQLEQQHEIELAAAHRIFGLLPDAQYQHFLSLWLEFEECKTHDAQFAKAVDRILPLIQNMANEGGSWAKHKVTKSQVLARNKYVKGLSESLWRYVAEQIDIATKNKWLVDV